LSPLVLRAQDSVSTSHLQIDVGGTVSCASNRWCLELRVVDQRSLQPLGSTTVELAGCGSFLSDREGWVHARCAQAGTVYVRVFQIGFRPLNGSVEVMLGRRYQATAQMAPPDEFGPDSFLVLCDEDDPALEQRCLKNELSLAEQRMAKGLLAARNTGRALPLLDSAQAAWVRFRTAQCAAEGALESNKVAAGITQLRCEIDLTEFRLRALENLWVLRR
jgi:uncharacterized protein YecT (DUF1311 family)